EQLAKPPEPWEFRSKKAWQRLLIMLGGIIVNVVLAFIIYSMILFVWGQKRLPVSEMDQGIAITDSLGYELGFRDGDKILEVNGAPMHYYDEIMPALLYAHDVVVLRDGEKKTLSMPVDLVAQLIDNKGKMLF